MVKYDQKTLTKKFYLKKKLEDKKQEKKYK